MEKVIIGKDYKAIISGVKPEDHSCNEDGFMIETTDGQRHDFISQETAMVFFNDNYHRVRSMSVSCSICNHAAIDNAIRMEY